MVLAAGATLDVSAVSGTYTLGGAATITADGNASAATIVGPVGGTVDLGSRPIVLTYDGTHPAISVSQGTVSLGGNQFTVNTANPLEVGDYPVIQQASGDVVATGPCTVIGTSIGLGFAGSIVVSGGQVNLHIISTATPTTTTLGTIATPQVYGATVLSANVVASDLSTVSGNVSFKDSGIVVGTAPVSGGTASLTVNLAVNGGAPHAIQALFSDPAVVYAGSSSAVSNLVITARPITVAGSKNYDGFPVIDSSNLSIPNNLDGANLTLSGTAVIAGRNVGPEAILSATYAAPARVQVATFGVSGNGAATFAVTLGRAPTSGNTLVAVIATRGTTNNTVTSITQANVTTWKRASQAANPGNNANGVTTEIWYAPVGASAGTAVTISQAASLRSCAIVVEYSGMLTSAAVDQTANATGIGTNAVTGTTSSTSLGNELWIGAIGLTNSAQTLGSVLNSFSTVTNAQSSYFQSTFNSRVYALEKIVSGTGTANSGGTISGPAIWAGAVATFYGVPGLSLGGSAAANYTVAGVSGTVTVVATNLTVTAATNTKAYDGTTTAAAIPALTAGNIQHGDTAPAWTESYDNSNAGVSKTLTPAGLVNDGNGGANYSYTYAPDHTGVITGSSSSVGLVSSTNPSVELASVTFTATVTGVPPLALPTGNVVFLANGTPFATNALSGGIATASTTALPIGHNAIIAQYLGNGAFPANSSSALDQVVTSSVIYSQTNVVVSLVNNRNGTFTINARGTPGAQYYVVASGIVRTNMAAWVPLAGTTNTATSPNGTWSCFVPSNSVPVFYRAAAVNPAPAP